MRGLFSGHIQKKEPYRISDDLMMVMRTAVRAMKGMELSTYLEEVKRKTECMKGGDHDKEYFRTLRRMPITDVCAFDVRMEKVLFSAAQLLNRIKPLAADDLEEMTKEQIEELGSLLVKLSWCVGNLEHSELIREAFDLDSRRKKSARSLGLSANEINRRFRVLVCKKLIEELGGKKYTCAELANAAENNKRVQTVFDQTAIDFGLEYDYFDLEKHIKRWRKYSGSKELLAELLLDEDEPLKRSRKATRK